MPIVYGKFYPEVKQAGLLSHRFRILIDPDGDAGHIYDLLVQLCTLRSYLREVVDTPAHLELYLASESVPDDMKHFELNPVSIHSHVVDRKQFLTSVAETTNADLIVTENRTLIESTPPLDDSAIHFKDYDEVLRDTEVFVRGHEVPWSFEQVVWNTPWQSFYSMFDNLGRKTFKEYQSKFCNIGLDAETLEIVRSLLLNRLHYICYTRDKLLFIVQQRRYAKRQGWQRQSFVFEAGYYVNHYYLLLSGGLDQIARLLNRILDLKVSDRITISISNPKFISKIFAKSKQIGELYSTKEFTEWLENLKTCRHYITHQGTIVLSPLVEKPEVELTEEDIEKEALSKREYLSVQLLPPHLYQEHLRILKQNVWASQFKVIRDDAMVIQSPDKQLTFFPLNDIEWHFENFKSVLLKTLELIYEHLRKENSNS